MIELPYIKCDNCKAKLYEFYKPEEQADGRVYNMFMSLVICGSCLSNYGRQSLVDNVRMADLPQ